MFFAYIDPGAGSLIFQALLVALMGMGITFRKAITNPVKRILRMIRKSEKNGK